LILENVHVYKIQSSIMKSKEHIFLLQFFLTLSFAIPVSSESFKAPVKIVGNWRS